MSRTPQQVIKRPLLTEKSARLRETDGAATTPAEGDTYSQKVVLRISCSAAATVLAAHKRLP